MTLPLVVPLPRWPARVALAVAIAAALLNATIAVVYGWMLGALFSSAESGEGLLIDPDTLVSSTPLLLVIGNLWYLTPMFWLVVMVLGLRSRGDRRSLAAMAIASASMAVFAVMLIRFSTGAF